MPRRTNGEPVENEERVAVAALRLCNRRQAEIEEPRFWVHDIQDELADLDPSAELNDSTVNRALNRFVGQGWMWAAWETADPDNRLSSRPRLYFRLTDDGKTAIRLLISSQREQLPLWVLYPSEILGETFDDHRLIPVLTHGGQAKRGRSRAKTETTASPRRAASN